MSSPSRQFSTRTLATAKKMPWYGCFDWSVRVLTKLVIKTKCRRSCDQVFHNKQPWISPPLQTHTELRIRVNYKTQKYHTSCSCIYADKGTLYRTCTSQTDNNNYTTKKVSYTKTKSQKLLRIYFVRKHTISQRLSSSGRARGHIHVDKCLSLQLQLSQLLVSNPPSSPNEHS